MPDANHALSDTVWNEIAAPNRRRFLLLSVIGLFIAAGSSPTQETVAQPRIETLIVDGFSNHDPVAWSGDAADAHAAHAGVT